MYKQKYFQPIEWACKCTRPDCASRARAMRLSDQLLTRLDLLRVIIGAPIVITSGCRCKEHNAAVGGAERSYHLQGRAADIKPRDPQLLPALIDAGNRLATIYLYKWTEFLPYIEEGFLHVAV